MSCKCRLLANLTVNWLKGSCESTFDSVPTDRAPDPPLPVVPCNQGVIYGGGFFWTKIFSVVKKAAFNREKVPCAFIFIFSRYCMLQEYCWESGQCCGQQGKCWMEKVKAWMSLSMSELLMMASRRKKNGRGSLLNHAWCLPNDPISQEIELNWTESASWGMTHHWPWPHLARGLPSGRSLPVPP